MDLQKIATYGSAAAVVGTGAIVGGGAVVDLSLIHISEPTRPY